MAMRSASIRSEGRQSILRWTRLLARVSHEVSWALKSWGEANVRPGRNEVSRYRLARSEWPEHGWFNRCDVGLADRQSGRRPSNRRSARDDLG
jgi:hypothetical protein